MNRTFFFRWSVTLNTRVPSHFPLTDKGQQGRHMLLFNTHDIWLEWLRWTQQSCCCCKQCTQSWTWRFFFSSSMLHKIISCCFVFFLVQSQRSTKLHTGQVQSRLFFPVASCKEWIIQQHASFQLAICALWSAKQEFAWMPVLSCYGFLFCFFCSACELLKMSPASDSAGQVHTVQGWTGEPINLSFGLCDHVTGLRARTVVGPQPKCKAAFMLSLSYSVTVT